MHTKKNVLFMKVNTHNIDLWFISSLFLYKFWNITVSINSYYNCIMLLMKSMCGYTTLYFMHLWLRVLMVSGLIWHTLYFLKQLLFSVDPSSMEGVFVCSGQSSPKTLAKSDMYFASFTRKNTDWIRRKNVNFKRKKHRGFK